MTFTAHDLTLNYVPQPVHTINAGLNNPFIPVRYPPGILDTQPDPLRVLAPSSRSRPGLDIYLLGLNPIPDRVKLPLDETDPMDRNVGSDTDRVRVQPARSPLLILPTPCSKFTIISFSNFQAFIEI